MRGLARRDSGDLIGASEDDNETARLYSQNIPEHATLEKPLPFHA
jgi:hypothetical protein